MSIRVPVADRSFGGVILRHEPDGIRELPLLAISEHFENLLQVRCER